MLTTDAKENSDALSFSLCLSLVYCLCASLNSWGLGATGASGTDQNSCDDAFDKEHGFLSFFPPLLYRPSLFLSLLIYLYLFFLLLSLAEYVIAKKFS